MNKEEFPFDGPEFQIGDKVRVKKNYREFFSGLVDPDMIHVVKATNVETVDRIAFEGQPDEAHYRFQQVRLDGIRIRRIGGHEIEPFFSSNRFELAG